MRGVHRASVAVVNHAPNAPDVAHNEAARRLSGYLFDMPEAARGDTFVLCDADAYANPYGAIRAFWKHARKAEAVGLLGTDAQMQQHGLNAYFRHPDGHKVPKTSHKEQNRTEFTYWTRLIKPWLSALVAPDGYSITMTKHFVRNRMHYWGAVAKR